VKKTGSSNYTLLWLIVLALGHSAVAQMIQISNVEELYSAVNDPANAGTTLGLSPERTCSRPAIPAGYSVPREDGSSCSRICR